MRGDLTSLLVNPVKAALGIKEPKPAETWRPWATSSRNLPEAVEQTSLEEVSAAVETEMMGRSDEDRSSKCIVTAGSAPTGMNLPAQPEA